MTCKNKATKLQVLRLSSIQNANSNSIHPKIQQLPLPKSTWKDLYNQLNDEYEGLYMYIL